MLVLVISLAPLAVADEANLTRPNIILFLADDMGYGDVAAINPEGKIPTPNLDRLIAGGMLFTDAHTNSAVCTPTRYGIMTGRYCWRGRLKKKVLWNYAGCLIEKDRLTLPVMLQHAGYQTAMIGKWHLGIDWHLKDPSRKNELRQFSYNDYDNIDFHSPIDYGINQYGFDYSFAIAGSANMTPFTFIENGKVSAIPTIKTSPNWIGSPGHKTPDFTIEALLPTFTDQACRFIEQAAGGNKPFFLYFAFNSPHTPVCPNPRFVGKSSAGAYGDFVHETDYRVGQVLARIREHHLEKNTLIIFTSDNGPEIDRIRQDKTRGDKSNHGHCSQKNLRGGKRMLYEGGHRVPFICRWPGQIPAGKQCPTTVCVTDIFATIADLVNGDLPENTAEDSISFLPALLGRESPESYHQGIIHHQASGEFAIRQGEFKLIVRGPAAPAELLSGKPDKFELYNLRDDITETRDLAEDNPDRVQRMYEALRRIVAANRSQQSTILLLHGVLP